MSSTFKIIWTKRARRDLAGIISNIEERWTSRAVAHFAVELREVERLIVQHPFIFQQKEKDSKERRALINNSHIAMTYQVSEYRIEIVSLYDTRQNIE